MTSAPNSKKVACGITSCAYYPDHVYCVTCPHYDPKPASPEPEGETEPQTDRPDKPSVILNRSHWEPIINYLRILAKHPEVNPEALERLLEADAYFKSLPEEKRAKGAGG